MKTLGDFLKGFEVEESAKTIFEIAGDNSISCDGFEFLTKPYCHFITEKDGIIYIKYEAPREKVEWLNNGIRAVEIYDGEIFDVYKPQMNTIIEM